MDWKERLAGNISYEQIKEFSSEGMAVRRIMKSIGASEKNIYSLCKRFSIDYREDETTFHRSVEILKAVYPDSSKIDFYDVKTTSKIDDLCEEISEDTRTGVIFARIAGTQRMTCLVKGIDLCFSELGRMIIQPGMKYLYEKSGMQIWEQEPVKLLKSFSQTHHEE